MKQTVPYTNCSYVNLTEKHRLSKVSGKSSYAFFLEYDYSSDTAKGNIFPRDKYSTKDSLILPGCPEKAIILP